jgi:hypothetical protein
MAIDLAMKRVPTCELLTLFFCNSTQATGTKIKGYSNQRHNRVAWNYSQHVIVAMGFIMNMT